jgi:hypothetical protein
MTTLAEIPDKWAQPPAEMIHQLPKGGRQLDYLGHAETTLILLGIDPEWAWEPFALDAHGLPALDADNNLWIRLTILGHTRIGVGDGPDMKQRIGDALRNAAMRFGIGTNLWVKDGGGDSQPARQERPKPPPAEPPAPETCTECGAEFQQGQKKQGRRGAFKHLECPTVTATEQVQAVFEGAEPMDTSPF